MFCKIKRDDEVAYGGEGEKRRRRVLEGEEREREEVIDGIGETTWTKFPPGVLRLKLSDSVTI